MTLPATYATVAQKQGDGLIIRIPAKCIKDLDLSNRDEVRFVMEKTGKVIPKKKDVPASWKARIDKARAEESAREATGGGEVEADREEEAGDSGAGIPASQGTVQE